MEHANLNLVQADIIYKALYYTAKSENLEISKELIETFEILAEENPNETHLDHTVEVMEYLSRIIKNSSEYSTYFIKEDDESEVK